MTPMKDKFNTASDARAYLIGEGFTPVFGVSDDANYWISDGMTLNAEIKIGTSPVRVAYVG